MTIQHYLRPLVAPTSVAMIGASERPGSLGRIVYENMLAADFGGEIYAINPNHKRILGHRSHRSLTALKVPVELAVIGTPCDYVRAILDEGGKCGLKAAAILTLPPPATAAARNWEREIVAAAAKHRIRLLGHSAFGVIRTDLALNATAGSVQALPGRLALIAQSGAVCSALLDFATPLGIGFSSVLALGSALDVDFGELLDALLQDPMTDGILLYIEAIHDARRFLSALRAAARTKPVVVLKSGRSGAADPLSASDAPTEDAVFDAALKRSGTIRVDTYTQLFAAARIISMGKMTCGDKLAVVTNGRGPGLMAVDAAAARGVPLARFTPKTVDRLDTLLPPEGERGNPLDVRGDASPQRMADAVAAVLADDATDAVLVLHVPLPQAPSTAVARAVADVARSAAKPVLSAWMGSLERTDARFALEAGGIANFYTPENAVDAFSCLASYRRNQQWLLEVPPTQPEPEPLDLATAERVRASAVGGGRTVLSDPETRALLAAFGVSSPATVVASSRAQAIAAARRIGFPVALKLYSPTITHAHKVARSRLMLRNGAMLARAYRELLEEARQRIGAHWTSGVVVQKMVALLRPREVAIGVHTDAVFGPVIMFGNGGINAIVEREKAVMLPPLNRSLAIDLVKGTRTARYLGQFRELPPADLEPLIRMLLQLSTMVCALPWVRAIDLNPVQVTADGAAIVDARIEIDPKRTSDGGGYRHMAIHPYPMELVGDAKLGDGTVLHIRPIRPEDAELERAFVSGLSDETRYLRFFHRLNELSPAMLARFTQVDYDREMALVAVIEANAAPMFAGVARYVTNPDHESAEFAVVVGDAWQGRGVARVLMLRLIECATRRGLRRLEGAVLRNNANMIKFVTAIGFRMHDDPLETDQVTAVLELN